MVLKDLLVMKTPDCIIFLEEETHIKFGNRFATHAGEFLKDGKTNKFWGHYNLTYIQALEDFTMRIKRGY